MTWSRHPVREVSATVETFGRAMRRLRRGRGWSQVELADTLAAEFPDVALSREVLSKLERGSRATLTVDEAVAIATVLNVTVSSMIEEGL